MNKEASEDRRQEVTEMLTVSEAAAYKNCTPDWVRKAIRSGKLVSEKRGLMNFVRREDLDRWTIIGHRPKKDGSSLPRPPGPLPERAVRD
jgi:excisionase family DNA binding protein